MMSIPQPGWYPDPQNAAFIRWWDGQRWTPHVQPAVRQVQRVAAGVASTNGSQAGLWPHASLAKENAPHLATPSTSQSSASSPSAAIRIDPRVEYTNLLDELPRLRAECAELRQQVVELREIAMLQEVGVYEYSHPLDSAIAYKGKLTSIQKRIKDAVKSGEAVKGAVTWSVNGSAQEGARMVSELSKLMLRAYNDEADDAVRTMKPYAIDAAKKRLEQARATISRLGTRMQIHVTDAFHKIRVEELELTADYLAKVAEEKEREREVRARLKEEETARKEFEREQAKLEKEKTHYEAAIEALKLKGDVDAVAKAEAKLAEIDEAIQGVTDRAANARAGYVYVISNVGSFGERVVKIGMTRRLDPMDRVRELGDASVPFRFDVHAIIFSDDAVSLETRLHQQFADHRVNLVNTHREYFFVTPVEVRDALAKYGANLLTFVEEPEALEWRQTGSVRGALSPTIASAFGASSPTAQRSELPPPVAVSEGGA